MPELNLNSTIQRITTAIAEAELEGNIVLLEIESGNYYNFNQTSSDIWRWLAEPVMVEELINRLFDKYQCSHLEATQDTLSFLNQLIGIKLLIFIG